jgi:hypothetical protein
MEEMFLKENKVLNAKDYSVSLNATPHITWVN